LLYLAPPKLPAQALADKCSKEVGYLIEAYVGDKDVILHVIEAKNDFPFEFPAVRSTEEIKFIAEAVRKQGVKSVIGY